MSIIIVLGGLISGFALTNGFVKPPGALEFKTTDTVSITDPYILIRQIDGAIDISTNLRHEKNYVIMLETGLHYPPIELE